MLTNPFVIAAVFGVAGLAVGGWLGFVFTAVYMMRRAAAELRELEGLLSASCDALDTTACRATVTARAG